ncbi:MAG: hypothetical protein AMQ74_01722 [Candidatus Methanofastidiosum methylothiophilum]|uniref:Uncharacterized protein n=1 Tax=Candidatus Methanofastidiosum methylothiophilum TaxID=1705564 RepID=A0A150IQB7_9EURY|nr:MAG: hypothetical protein AMQ74_01722 [Candidatus Methanofastidiosum methylthiophilus]
MVASAPSTFRSPALIGLPFLSNATVILESFFLRSIISVETQTIDIISEAAVIMNLDSRGIPLPDPPSPITMFLKALSFMSIALGQTILLISMSSSFPINIWVSSIAARRLCAA